MKDTKIRCDCGCNNTLYVTDWESEVMIGSEENARKSFKHFKGVVVDRKKLINLLKDNSK